MDMFFNENKYIDRLIGGWMDGQDGWIDRQTERRTVADLYL